MPAENDDDQHRVPAATDGLLSLRQMEVFHAVMQARSITGASKVLTISQPALSRTIRRIEDLLGIALFARDRNGLVPTSEALEIYAEIDPLIRQLTGVGTQIGRIARGETAVFRVGSTASVARALVPQALRTLSVEVPGIELFFDVLPVDQIEEYLITGRGEAVVTIASLDHPLIEREHVGRVDLVAVIPKSHSLAARPVIHAADLADVDFISFAAGGAHQTIVDRFLSREKLKVNTRAVARFSDTGAGERSYGYRPCRLRHDSRPGWQQSCHPADPQRTPVLDIRPVEPSSLALCQPAQTDRDPRRTTVSPAAAALMAG